jgi:hypothetical protein
VRRRIWAALAVVVLGAGACSGGPSGEVKSSAAPALEQQVQQVRDAVATDSEARVVAALDALRRLVDRDRANGSVSDSRAIEILDAADTLQQHFTDAHQPTPTPTPSPTPTPTPTATTPPPTTPPPTTPPPTTPPTAGPTTPAPTASVTVGLPGVGATAAP